METRTDNYTDEKKPSFNEVKSKLTKILRNGLTSIELGSIAIDLGFTQCNTAEEFFELRYELKHTKEKMVEVLKNIDNALSENKEFKPKENGTNS